MSDAISNNSPIATGTNLTDGKLPSTSTDKDMFLRLLVTQMKNQDPTKPVDNSQMLSQMAQFTSLEQMQNMNTNLTQSQAYGMIGKTVIGTKTNLATNIVEQVVGTVDSVTLKGSKTYLNIGNDTIDATTVTAVTDTPSPQDQSSQALSLVGKNIQAIITDSDGNPTDFVEGKVDYIQYNKGVPVLMVGNKQVMPNEILTVSDKNLINGTSINIETTDPVSGDITKITGIIDGINFKDTNPFISVNGTAYPISKINYITEANQYIGQQVSSGDVSGIADGVTLKDGDIYVNVGDKAILYTDLRDGK